MQIIPISLIGLIIPTIVAVPWSSKIITVADLATAGIQA